MANFRDILRVQGVKARGFGIIPKIVMLDRQLTIEAKAIYSYFCSYAGAGDTAFPGRDKILKDLGIGKDRYYVHRGLLEKYGYLEVEQVMTEKNKFSHNIYTLVDKPIENTQSEPSPENKDTEEKPSPENPDTKNEYTENKDTNINKSFYNQQSSILLSVSQEEKGRLKKQHDYLCGQCQTYLFKDSRDTKLVENAIMDLMYLREVKVKNRTYAHDEIMDKLSGLDFDICYYALDKFREVESETNIKNKAKYFSILLFNAIDEYYAG